MSNGDLIEAGGELALQDPQSLLEMAEKAEKLILAVKKIKEVVFAVTNANDWIDEGGKPYLQVSGAEKICPIFGIDWDIDNEPEIEEHPDGHRTYKFKGIFRMGNKTKNFIGSRSSKDPFFSRANRADVPPEKINMTNVEKAAFTNLIGNGITRTLGIRNMTWDELHAAGIKKGSTAKVDRSGVPLAPAYGKYAKKPLTEVDDEWLAKYANAKAKQLDDPTKKDFRAQNERDLKALIAEQDRRKEAKEADADLSAELDRQAEEEARLPGT